jgi:hypothetical protein
MFLGFLRLFAAMKQVKMLQFKTRHLISCKDGLVSWWRAAAANLDNFNPALLGGIPQRFIA